MFADRAAGALHFCSEERTQYADVSKAADANVAVAARPRRGSTSVVGKELPVTFLDVGIPVPSRGEHEFDIALEVIVGIVASARYERRDEHFGKLKVQRVFPGMKELVIVDSVLPRY